MASSSVPIIGTDSRLKLSWASLGSSSSADNRCNVAHSIPKRNRQSLVAQASGDKVCLLLNGVQLVHTLPFWSSFSNEKCQMGKADVACVCIAERADSSELFITAAAGNCVVVWSTISTITNGKEKWQVHSTITVDEGSISSIDMQKDMLLIGSENCLMLWKLSSESRPSWTRRWRLRTPKRVLQSLFCPDEASFAVLLKNDRRTCIWRLPKGQANAKPELSCTLSHSRTVKEMSWRREPGETGSTSTVVTRTSDGVVRLWTSVIDEPNLLRVWSTIDPSAMMSDGSQDEKTMACYYLDALDMSIILKASLQRLQRDLQMAELGVGIDETNQEERVLELKRSRARRLEHLVTETPDMFAMLQSDGTLVIRALANVDRRPPTLCQSFVVLKMASKIVIELSLVSSISAHALNTSASSNCYNPTGLLYLALHSGDIVKYQITPSLLFDGLGDGLTNLDHSHNPLTPPMLRTSNAKGMIAIADGALEQDCNVELYNQRSSFYTTAAETILKVPDTIIGLAWSPCSDVLPMMLAVACHSAVYILCRRRLSYIDRLQSRSRQPQWITIAQADLSSLGALPVASVAWQSDNSLLVGSSNLILGFKGELLSTASSSTSKSHLIQLAVQESSPLPDVDPEVILQCLLWNKVGVALQIFANLASSIDSFISSDSLHVRPIEWTNTVDIEKAWNASATITQTKSFLDENENGNEVEKEREISMIRLQRLLGQLQSGNLPSFEPAHQVRLTDMLEITLTIQRSSGLLDADALRYLTSLHYIEIIQVGKSLDLNYKSFLSAFYSRTQTGLIQTLDTFYEGKMNWEKACRSGIFLWIHSQEDLIKCAEQVARQQFSGQDERDPTACSLLYYALGKQKLVANLWRQAFWHKDQKKMLQFLNNDFSLPRWKTAAFKNAFALMSQRRFEMAASFFLLGGGLKDAVNVCVRNMGELSLGIAIARLYEGGTKGPVFSDLLRNDVLLQALQTDNRWLAHWALIELNEKALSVQVLCQPVHKLRAAFPNLPPTAFTDKNPEDAEVALFFSRQMEEHQTLSEDLPTDVEARLVLQAHHTLCADGLDALGLAILQTHKLRLTRLPTRSQKQTISKSVPAFAEKEEDESLLIKPEKKVKVASLIQTAKPDSSKQAEMTFDVNSFNF